MNQYGIKPPLTEQYDTTLYEKPSVAVDLLIFTIEDDRLKVLMIRRDEAPYQGMLALPGVFVGIQETLDDAALRGIKEETGLTGIYMEQMYTWGQVERDPRTRVISVSYIALVNADSMRFTVGERVSEVGLYGVEDVLQSAEIAFDHREMIQCGIARIQNKTEYTNIAFEFVPEEFTLPQLQKVYEILLGKSLYKTNFRNKVKLLIEETGAMKAGEANRPSKYYRKVRV